MTQQTEESLSVFAIRDKILKPYTHGSQDSDIYHFSIPFSVLVQMVDLGFADPKGYHNESPSIKEFVKFARHLYKKHPKEILLLKFIGYAVSPTREDCRVSIDGISVLGILEPGIIRKLIKFARKYSADEVDFVYGASFRAWWD